MYQNGRKTHLTLPRISFSQPFIHSSVALLIIGAYLLLIGLLAQVVEFFDGNLVPVNQFGESLVNAFIERFMGRQHQ